MQHDVETSVRRAFALIYGHVRGRFMQNTLGFSKEKFRDMLRADRNYEQFNALYERWLKEIHSAAAEGRDPNDALADASKQLNAIALRYPDDEMDEDYVPPHYALDPKLIPEGADIDPAILKMLLNPAPGASTAYLNGLRKAYNLPKIPNDEELTQKRKDAAINRQRAAKEKKPSAPPKARPELDLTASPELSTTAHSPQPTAPSDSADDAPWTLTAEDLKAPYVPRWKQITGLRWLDSGRVPPDTRSEALRKICAIAKADLEREAGKFEIPEEGFANRPPGPEPTHAVAANLGLPESKLNAIMNEFTGMTARETWDYVRMEKVRPCIGKNVRKLMDTMGACHSLHSDQGVSGLRAAKRLSGRTMEQFAEDVGFKNVSRLKRGCLNKFSTCFARMEVIELEHLAPEVRASATGMEDLMRPRAIQFGSQMSETIMTFTPAQLRAGLLNPDGFFYDLEDALVSSPKNRKRDGSLLYDAEFMYKNRMAPKSPHEQAFWNAKIHPERIYVSTESVIDQYLREKCPRRAGRRL